MASLSAVFIVLVMVSGRPAVSATFTLHRHFHDRAVCRQVLKPGADALAAAINARLGAAAAHARLTILSTCRVDGVGV